MSKEDLLDFFFRGQIFLSEFEQAQELAKELFEENEALKLKVNELETELSENNSLGKHALQTEIKKLQAEVKKLQTQNSSIRAESKNFINRYLEMEKQNEGLINLYVASYQLHSTLDSQMVVNIIVDILSNLIGAEEFAVFTLNEAATELSFMGGELAESKHQSKKKILLGQGVEGEVAVKRKIYRGDKDSDILIAVPLEISLPAKASSEAVNELVGIISIYKFLSHKKNFTSVDFELLNLLAGQAATALLCAKLYQGTERKLRTIEGFMNLLRQS
ncbi:MAG: GAF domain-containing protein [Blastocatellia bacterium]